MEALASAKTTVLQSMGNIYVTMQEIAKLQVKADEKTKSTSKASEEKKEE